MDSVSLLIVDKKLDAEPGVLANCALVVGLTVGKEIPESTFGGDVTDGDGQEHKYLTQIGHHVRKANQTKMRTLREHFSAIPEVLVVDYTEDAAPADYAAYADALGSHSGEEIEYRALYLYGPAEEIVPKTKNLSRM